MHNEKSPRIEKFHPICIKEISDSSKLNSLFVNTTQVYVKEGNKKKEEDDSIIIINNYYTCTRCCCCCCC